MNPERSSEAGFTLVELLVGMALSLIVLFAVLNSLDVFNRDAAQQTRATDANERARATMDRVVDDLRGAARIRTAAAGDLVYSVPTTTGTRSERVCVAASRLYRATSTSSTVATTPCGVASAGWTQGAVARVPAATTTAFSYDGAASAATPAKVRTVGLTFTIDASGAGRTASSTLRASGTLRRAAGQLPIGDGDVTAECNAGGALLTLDAAAVGGLGLLGVTYTATGGVALTPPTATTPVQLPKGVTQVVATITDAAGVTTTLQKPVECT